jgi:hypothetical protein
VIGPPREKRRGFGGGVGQDITPVQSTMQCIRRPCACPVNQRQVKPPLLLLLLLLPPWQQRKCSSDADLDECTLKSLLFRAVCVQRK